MKTSRFNTTMVALFCVGVLSVACGSGSDEGVDSNEGNLLRITEFTLRPNQVEAFEAGWQEQNANLEATNSAFGVQVSQSGAGRYRVIRNMGTWGGFEQMEQEIQARRGTFPQSIPASVDHLTSTVVRTRPDLAYFPENPRLEQGEFGFIKYFFWYTYPGTRQEAEDIIRRNSELRRSLGLGTPMIVTQTVMGPDSPMWLLRFHYRDIEDFYRTNAEESAAMGQEFQDQLAEFYPLTRHIEQSNNVVRRDLMYQPSN